MYSIPIILLYFKIKKLSQATPRSAALETLKLASLILRNLAAERSPYTGEPTAVADC